MAFSDEVKEEAYGRAEGRCECKRDSCATHYLGRCPTSLSMRSAVFIRKKQTTLGDPDKLTNCEVVCELCASNAAFDEFATQFGAMHG